MNMMACEKMRARIPIATCVGRQTKGIIVSGRNESTVYSIPYECRDCEPGRAVLAGGPPNRKQKEESVKKACRNCGRVMSIVRGGCCFTCDRAGKGLSGEAKSAALAETKKRIESGGLKRTGSGGRKKARVSAPEVAMSLARGLDGKGSVRGGGPRPKRLPAMAMDPGHYVSGTVHLDEVPSPADIPVRIRLMIEVSVRVATAAA